MLDIKLIRQNPEEIEKKLKTKDPEISLKEVLKQDEELRSIIGQEQDLQTQRNQVSKEIGMKKQKKEDAEDLLKQMQGVKNKIEELSHKRKEAEISLLNALAVLPNIPQDEIPVSLNKEDNVCVKEVGKKPTFSFKPKNHLELNENLHLFDFQRAAKITGSGWPCYTGLGARLEWALLNYMLDVHKQNGFQFILPPLLVRDNIMFSSGQLPKFEDQLYSLQDDEFRLFLIPTAEVPLCGLHTDEILDAENLPIKYVSYTPCFRREAGAAGKQERGLIRTHQFNKVEMFAYTTQKQSTDIFQEMLSSAEEVLKGLELHYKNMLLVTGDMSFASTKTIDIEVFLPGQERYYEVSSVSNCTDYQARRGKIRCKMKNNKPELVHTLNGSGLATSRLMIALLENNQQEDGSVKIPSVLHKYLEEEITHIKPKKA